jgi:hypothetical protein
MECGDLRNYVMTISKIIISHLMGSVWQTVIRVLIIIIQHVIRIYSIGNKRTVIYLETLPILRRHVVIVIIKMEHYAIEILQR